MSTEHIREIPKKKITFWSHTGNSSYIKKMFPDAEVQVCRYKYGLPLVDLWTLSVVEEEVERVLLEIAPLKYNFDEEEREFTLILREVIKELTDWVPIGTKPKDTVLVGILNKLQKFLKKD